MSHLRTVRFDGWVLHMDSGELAKDGRKTRLQDQPLQILEELLRQPGELVTREQLIARLWPKGVVDFDTGLNSAVRKLRIALQDEVETPRYIETVPRKGYRFIAAIDAPTTAPQPSPPPAPAPPAAPALPAAPVVRSRRTYLYVGGSIALLLIAALTFVATRHESPPASQSLPISAPPSSLDSRTIAVLPFRPATPGEANEELALVVTDVLRNRLAAIDGVISIGTGSMARLANPDLDPREIGRKLNARFLLQGSTARLGDQISTDAELIDAVSGAKLWSASFDHSVREVALLREAIVERVAHDLHIAAQPAAGPAAASAAIVLDAYLLHVRGWRLMGDGQQLDKVKAAIELFRRATILDPTFALGYLSLEEAQLQADFLTNGQSPELVTEARQSLDRALELDPALGAAWIDRASLAKDPVKAEEWYRKGLALAPSYGAGYAMFSRFLFGEHRKGEAIEMIDRARQLDPLTPDLHLTQAFFVMVGKSDVAAHDRLVREALTISPGYEPALFQLAVSKYEYSGQFAQAIRLAEEAISQHSPSDRHSTSGSRNLAATIYLDLDDPVAATALIDKSPDDAPAQVKIAQYQHDPRRAAELAWSVHNDTETAPTAPIAEALRDGAIASGDYARVLKQFEARYAIQATEAEPRVWSRGLGLVYAHTLVLAGETERGRKLATSILVQLDAESVGRTENWFCRERAAAFTILGDDERALAELAIAQSMGKYYRWRYLAELDPLFARFRSEPRFRALAEQARKYRVEQRALLEQMRSKGEVPKRS
jgi:DNA-binding winged helix-turn-helix (wHTH) protein/TolB-like protein/Tfp pilus assembly protein PilF